MVGYFCLGFLIRLFNYKIAISLTNIIIRMISGNKRSNKDQMLPYPPIPFKKRLSLRLGREESEELFISHEALRVTRLRSTIQNGWEQSAKHGNRLYF